MNEQEANEILDGIGLDHAVDADGDFKIWHDDGWGTRYFYMTGEALEAALFLVRKHRILRNIDGIDRDTNFSKEQEE